MSALEAYALDLEAEWRRRQALKNRPHVEYQKDPIAWAVEKLGVREETIRWSLNPGYKGHVWSGTPEPLVAMFEALADWKDTGVESATTTGKSYGGAILVLWFLACWEGAQVYTFAPVERQLKLYIWRHIGEFWPRFHQHFPMATLSDLTLRMRGGLDETWAAHGQAVGIKLGEQVATGASGMHAEHMLLIYEEGQGQPPAVMDAGENAATAPHNLRLAIGNPNHQLDPLHKFCISPGVAHIRVSALDHPNVVSANPNLIPGAVSQGSINKRKLKYGETSPVYQSRVLGVSPEQASDALIRLDWLKRSAERFAARKVLGTLGKRLTGKGVDVANSEHGDRASICDFFGNACPTFPAFQCPDANALGRRIKLEMDAGELENKRCGIDATGVGSGTVNELRRLGRSVQGLHFGSPAMKMVEKAPDGQAVEWSSDVNLFASSGGLRSQMYWQAREDLRTDAIDVEEDQELWEELTAPTFVDEPKTIVEPKAEIRERLGRSPDKADAFVLANWVRVRAVKPEKTHPSKQPHRAWPLEVKDGKLVKPRQAPKNVEELAAWAEERSTKRRLAHRERTPRRVYR